MILRYFADIGKAGMKSALQESPIRYDLHFRHIARPRYRVCTGLQRKKLTAHMGIPWTRKKPFSRYSASSCTKGHFPDAQETSI